MPSMNQEAIRAFLDRPLIAVLTTKRAGGGLQSTPVWFEYRDGAFYFWVAGNSTKARNVAAEDLVSVCVATQDEPYEYVTADGECRISEADRERCFSICRRYYDQQAAEDFLRDTLSGSVLLVMTPERIRGEAAP